MTFLILMAMAEFLLFLLMISIGVLISCLEKAFTESQKMSDKEREHRENAVLPEQDYTEQLRAIRRNCEQIEADVFLQNQLHYWNSWNRNNEFRNLH